MLAIGDVVPYKDKCLRVLELEEVWLNNGDRRQFNERNHPYYHNDNKSEPGMSLHTRRGIWEQGGYLVIHKRILGTLRGAVYKVAILE